MDFIKKENADIVCLQEIKAFEEQLPKDFKLLIRFFIYKKYGRLMRRIEAYVLEKDLVMNKEKINICLSSDDNFAHYLLNTITSILKNANEDDEIYFYI